MDNDIQQDVSNRVGQQTQDTPQNVDIILYPNRNFLFEQELKRIPDWTKKHPGYMCCCAIWLAVLCFVYFCRYKALRSESVRELVHMGIAEDSISPHKHNWCVVNNDGKHRAYLIDVGRIVLASKGNRMKAKKRTDRRRWKAILIYFGRSPCVECIDLVSMQILDTNPRFCFAYLFCAIL